MNTERVSEEKNAEVKSEEGRIQTEEITVYQKIFISDQQAEVGLEIPENEDDRFQIIFYVKETPIYQSPVLYGGTHLPIVELSTENLTNGSYSGSIEIRKINDKGKDTLYKQKKVVVDINIKDGGPYIVEGGKG